MIYRMQEIQVDIPEVFKEVEAVVQQMIAHTKFLNSPKIHMVGYDDDLNDGFEEFMKGKTSTLEPDEKDLELYYLSFQEYVFGGGAISDLYLHQRQGYTQNQGSPYPFFDVDIFINEKYLDEEFLQNNLKEALDFNSFEVDDHYRHVFEIKDITRFSYKGINFELIGVQDMRKVEVFDFRFRNFFYKRGKSFASQGALMDIAERKLVVQSAHTPLSTMIRMFEFQERYNFEIDRQSLDWIRYALNEESTPLEELDWFISNQTKDAILANQLREKIMNFIGNKIVVVEDPKPEKTVTFYRDNEVKFPFSPQAEEIYQKADRYFDEEIHRLLQEYKHHPLLTETRDFTYVDKDSFCEAWRRIDELVFKKVIDTSFVMLLKHGNSIDFDVVRSLADMNSEERTPLLYEDNVYSKEMIKWVNAKTKDNSGSKLFILAKDLLSLTKIKLSFHYSSTKLKCTLNHDFVKAKAETRNPDCYGTFAFRKTARGVFTFAENIYSHSTFVFRAHFIRALSHFLRDEFGPLFDVGIPGELASSTPPSYYNPEHFFQRDGKQYRFQKHVYVHSSEGMFSESDFQFDEDGNHIDDLDSELPF